MNTHERKLKAEKARILLDDVVFRDAVAGVESAAIEKMITAKTDDERRECRDLVLAVRSVKAQLHSWQVDGQLLNKALKVA